MMDDIDQKIVAALIADGRAGNNTIARQLDISEGTVRNRIRKLIDSGYLWVSAWINPEMVDNYQLFMLGVKVSASKDLTKIATAIAELKEVQSVCISTGRYDLLVEVWLPSKHGLIEFIDGPMIKIDGIVSTESFLAMKTFKKWLDPGQ
ncbi:MAG: Lrp/AsnC family transcriptional regulator [Victivallaceae bacterium]|nr:Lrp/AsnC family transcriptional regulator [Victivallaceae bacterium]